MDEKENTRELVVVDVKRYKKVKSALKESEERYRQLFENVPIGIYRTTPDGRIVDANPALVKMLGYVSFAELSSRNLEKEYADNGSSRKDFIKHLQRDGEIKGLETVWKRKDGSSIHIRENAKLTRTEDGQVLFEGTVEDITLSKQAEAAEKIRTQQLEILNCIISSGNLADSMAEMLEKVLDCLVEPLAFDMAGIYMYDPESKKVNLLVHRGRPKKFALNDQYMSIDSLPFSQVLLCGQPVFVDNIRGALPDLAKKWGWQMACSIPLVSKGRVVGAMNVASCSRSVFSADEKSILELIGKEAGTLISKLQTETALRESEKFYRTLIDTSPDVIVVMDLQAKLLTVNQQFLKMGGYDYDAVIGASTYDFVVGFDRISLEKKTAKFVKSREMSGSEYQFKKKDGQVIPLEVAAGLLNDDAGHTKGIIAVGRDITERKQAEKLTIALYKISQAVYSTDNLDELFMHIHRVLSGIIPAANLFIALLSDGGKTLTFPYVVDEKDAGAAPIIEVDDSQSLTVEVLKTKKTLLLDEVELNERYATGRSKIWETAPKCWLGVPLMIRETVIGVMVVQDYNKGDVFSPKDVTLLESAAGQIAIAIDRKRTESQREAALDALRQSEETFRRTFEVIPDPAYIWARQGDGRFILSRFNRAASQITKGEIKSFLGMEPHLMFADYPKLLENIDSGIIRGGSQNTEFLYKYQSTGESRWLLVDSAKTSDDSVLVITKDITERKQAEAKLLAYQEQLQALTSELILIEEKERRRIASELHDQIGQNLALCKLKVAALEKNVADDTIKMEMTAVLRLLECSMQDTRSLIFDLSPPILYELGLKAALEWLAERIQEQYHVPIEFESHFGDPELDNDQQVILFQVVRELLVNVGKHSRASQAKVILSPEGPFLKIQVNDNGVGFDASQIFNAKEQNSGFGFFSMRERLNYLGGVLEVKSKTGQGSQIILTVPQQGGGAVPRKENS